ncbi:hypothetical protein Vretifemale_19717 [Volvox reticuliferus]|uniref:Uncharacterized protein n=1 Tax=Volvox reticuliferus TaxID=1737510 RepID=A0A8J4D227_9CHLO|nr:hypothetical protein Vretifemale_19717 [Volvox reticuliferus]
MELLNLNAVARIKSLRRMRGVDYVNQNLVNIVETPSGANQTGVAFSASTPITVATSSAASTNSTSISSATSPSVSALTERPTSDSYAASVAPTVACSPNTSEDGSSGDRMIIPPLKCDSSSDPRVPYLGQESLRYQSAEDALARALHLILKLDVSESGHHTKILEARAAVAEAVPLVWGLRKEVDGLRTQLDEYGKLMAERDNSVERLRADLTDLEEARSLDREHLNTAVILDALDDCRSSNMMNKMPCYAAPTAALPEPSVMLKTRSCRRLNVAPTTTTTAHSRLQPQMQPLELAPGCLPLWESWPSPPVAGPAAAADTPTTTSAAEVVQPVQPPPRDRIIASTDRRRTDPNFQIVAEDGVMTVTPACSIAAIISTAPTAAAESGLRVGALSGAHTAAVSHSNFSTEDKRFGPSSSDGLPYNSNDLSYMSDYISDFSTAPSADNTRDSLCGAVSSAFEGYGLSAASTLVAAASRVRKLLSGNGKLNDDGEGSTPPLTSSHLAELKGGTALDRHPSYICRRPVAHNGASSSAGGAISSSVRARVDKLLTAAVPSHQRWSFRRAGFLSLLQRYRTALPK